MPRAWTFKISHAKPLLHGSPRENNLATRSSHESRGKLRPYWVRADEGADFRRT